ncbi:Serine/threonine-protein kinase PknA [Acidipropionibacterium virtanenii]|uniref:non-specific serine/threonine protein kinase n=2 Tax=Acidipropionibacterium virtanenii TaxID=2057246 RepID=A0A344UUR6_9ACTN|nr:Serine/threonine-protein kinase PknA [Acidipropionibacterium virtanenii]
MGQVWRAKDRAGRPYAVKMLLPVLANDPEIVRRFVTERSITLQINDPHVVRVRDMVVEGQTLAIVMDLVNGTDLKTKLATNGPLPPAEVAYLGAQIAGGLAAVHAKGIVHRDVKPANVLLTPGPPETARLTDFGVSFLQDASHLSHITAVVGTPNYVAPEIVLGKRPVPASDLYSLGIMLYELVCGITPFATGSTMTVLRGHCELTPGRPDGFPEPLWRVVAWLLSKDPDQRPESARQIAVSLEQMIPGLVGVAPLPRLTTPPRAVPLPLGAQAWQPTSFSSAAAAAPVVPDAADTVLRPSPVSQSSPPALQSPVSQPSPVSPAEPAQLPAEPSAPRSRKPGKGLRRTVLAAGISALVIAGAGGGYLLSQHSSDGADPVPTATTGPASPSQTPTPSRTPTPTATSPTTPRPSVIDASTSAYRNARYGFSFTAPVGWTRTDNADGSVTITSADKKSTIRGYGTRDTLSSCGGRADACLEKAKAAYKASGATVTYWQWGAQDGNWYIVSGVRSNGTAYYERRVIGKASSNVLVAETAGSKQVGAAANAASSSFKAGNLDVTH